ncbi:MAG: hypothetical protein ACI8W8_004361 [Rhodothermales bacterium]|jgi:hypothetical protein
MTDDLQYRGHSQLFYRGALYLSVAFILVIAEFAAAVAYDVPIAVLLANDFLAGFIFWRTRRILFPLAASIIDRFGDAVLARRAFAVLLLVFGLLFMALQLYTIVAIGREMSMVFAIPFAALQLVSAYTGHLMMRLGGAIWHGREPEFANRARKRVEQLRERLLARREQAIRLRTLPESERQRAFEHAGPAADTRIYRSIDFKFVAFIGFGVMWYLVVARLWATLIPMDRAIFIGMGTFGMLLGIGLWIHAKRRSRRVYLDISKIGLRCHGPLGIFLHEEQGSQSWDNHEPGELAFLWAEFFFIQASPGAGSVCFYHFERDLRIYVREEHFNVAAVRKRIRAAVDTPDLLTGDADLMDVDEFYFPPAV